MRRSYIFISLLSIFFLVACSSDIDNVNKKSENLKITDYFPGEKIVKVFNGGFENAGTVYIVDRIEGDKIQIKKIDTGTGGIYVYKVSDEEIKQIYYSGEYDFTDKSKEDFLNKEPNNDSVVLKAPLEIGAIIGEWKVEGIDLKINTPSGEYETVKLVKKLYDKEYIVYYAKKIGSIKRVLKFDDGIELTEELVKVEKLKIKNELSNKEMHKIVNQYLK